MLARHFAVPASIVVALHLGAIATQGHRAPTPPLRGWRVDKEPGAHFALTDVGADGSCNQCRSRQIQSQLHQREAHVVEEYLPSGDACHSGQQLRFSECRLTIALDDIAVSLLNGAATCDGYDVSIEAFALLANFPKTFKGGIGRLSRNAPECRKFLFVDDCRCLCPGKEVRERLKTFLIPRLGVAAGSVQKIEDCMSADERFCGPFTHWDLT